QAAITQFFDGQAPDRSVNPDEAVALGASIQAGVLGGEVKNLLLLDVTPLSLGIETLGDVFTKIIERNTTIPTSKTQIFSTAIDGQTSVEVHALQGERAMARDNKSLGRFELTGIPPAPRGVPQIEVSFEINADGILQVAAKDRGTNREQSIKITNRGGLSPAEIARMKEEAEIYAGEDEQRKLIAELQNKADSLFYSYESAIRDGASTISDELKAQAEAEAAALRAAVSDKNVEPAELVQKLDALQQTIFNIGAGMYRQAASDDSAGGDINSGMPGANLSTPDPEAPVAEKVSVGVVAKASELSSEVSSGTNGATSGGMGNGTNAAVDSPSVQAADYQAATVVATEPTKFAAAHEEEFDIDCTVAADYEAIE
ncbi:MAG: Hsp70 family protein, partial [Cyanobacteria bacterium J06555_13]